MRLKAPSEPNFQYVLSGVNVSVCAVPTAAAHVHPLRERLFDLWQSTAPATYLCGVPAYCKSLWYNRYIMSTRRPLHSVEVVPSHLPSFLDFDDQRTIEGPKSRRLSIARTCSKCGSRGRVLVEQVRASVRKNSYTGLCKKCAERRTQPQPRGDASPNWKGGRRTTPKGYVMVLRPDHPRAQNGYVQEHRLAMEEHLGRPLLPTETVHHKNGVKHDNSIENLEVWGSYHGNGHRYEDLSVVELKALIAYLEQLVAEKTLEGLPR